MITPLVQSLTPLGKANTVFDPLSLVPSFWVDGSNFAASSDGTLLSTWADQSGNTKDATAAGANRPTVKTTAGALPIGLPTLFFSSNIMSVPAIDLSATAQVELLAVVQQSRSADNAIVEFSTNNNGSATGFLFACDVGQKYYMNAHGNVGNSHYTSPGSQTSWVIISAFSDKSLSTNESSLWINGSAVAGSYVTNSNNTNSFGNNQLFIGARFGNIIPFQGYLYAVFLVPRILTTTERTNLVNYYKSKTGIS